MPEKPYLIQFDRSGDPAEGYITSTQYADKIPFAIRRVFWTYGTPEDVVRGRHAHKVTQQVLVALNGQIKVSLDNGLGFKEAFDLHAPGIGLYLPPMHWANIYLSPGAILLSLTSTDFEESDYYREYDLFQEAVKLDKTL